MAISLAKWKGQRSKFTIVNPHTAFTERMLKWGRENEHVAIHVYKGLPERNHVLVYECGIYISPENPYLAATPDRVCYDPREKNPWGIIEVKCPFKEGR